MGSSVAKMIRIRMLNQHSKMSELHQYSCIMGGIDGSLSVVQPISEKIYRRLYSLYSRMVTSLQHVGGLNPRGYRHVPHSTRPLATASTIASGPPGPKFILDGDLLLGFLNLSFVQQQELAHATGSNVERIMDDILEVTNRFNYF